MLVMNTCPTITLHGTAR